MRRENHTISIAIINLNGERWIKNLIDSIKNALGYANLDDWEILLIDNGSSDKSPDIFMEQFNRDDRVIAVKNKENLGWSPAVNQAFEMSCGNIIVVLSNDMEIEKNSIESILRIMEGNPKIGIVQFNSIRIHDRKTQDSGKNYTDRFGFLYGYKASKFPQQVGMAEGMAFAVSRKLIKEGVKMDDSFFMMYDDADFSYRARMMGYEVVFNPDSVVYHHRGGTVGKNARAINPSLVKNGTRNHLTFILKCYELKNVLMTFPIAFSISFIESFVLLRVDRRKFSANMSALIEVFLRISKTAKQRKEIQHNRKIPDRELFRLAHRFRPFSLIKNSAFTATNFSPKEIEGEIPDLIERDDPYV